MSRIGIWSPRGLCHIIGLSLLFFNIGCAGTNGWAMNRSGMKQYARGHYAQARHRFARAVAHNPWNPDYRHNLAMAIQKQGDPVASERILRHNLTIDAMHQPTYHALAQLMVNQGRNSEAQDLLTSWVATQPYIPEANIEMAWFQRESGDYGGAEMSLQQALKAQPAHPVALAQLGQLYQSTGRNDLAADYYQRSLASNWDQPEVQSRLATLSDPQMMPRSRSAMMQNTPSSPMLADMTPISADGYIAAGPALSNEPMMVSYNSPVAEPMPPGAPMLSAEPNFQVPMTIDSQMVAMAPTQGIDVPFGSDPNVTELEGVNANPAPKRRHHRKKDKQKDPVMATYPLPSFDSSNMAWVPAGTNGGQPQISYQTPTTFQAPMMNASLTPIPTYGGQAVAGGTYSPTPINADAQGLVPQADPAHFYGSSQEMTASLPVVDPH